ncbi:hypothetical protein BH11PSE9_BH11PSE9_06030 [soil metagenome]
MFESAVTAHALRAVPVRCHAAVVMVLGAFMLGGCGGGGGDGSEGDAMPSAASASSLSARLDADTLPSIDMAAQQAADARGAPGDAEAVAYSVTAERPEDAVRMAAALEARGFAPVRVVARSASELPR